MKASVRVLMLLGLMLAGISHGEPISLGERLTPLSIADRGEIRLVGDKLEYSPWGTAHLQGKVQVVQYLAARPGIDKVNQAFNSAIEAAGFPEDKFATTILVNVDDALFGTSGLVYSQLKNNKIRHPNVVIVVDRKGQGRAVWQLEAKSAAVAILDTTGRVLFFREGAMSASEVDTGIDLIRRNLW